MVGTSSGATVAARVRAAVYRRPNCWPRFCPSRFDRSGRTGNERWTCRWPRCSNGRVPSPPPPRQPMYKVRWALRVGEPDTTGTWRAPGTVICEEPRSDADSVRREMTAYGNRSPTPPPCPIPTPGSSSGDAEVAEMPDYTAFASHTKSEQVTDHLTTRPPGPDRSRNVEELDRPAGNTCPATATALTPGSQAAQKITLKPRRWIEAEPACGRRREAVGRKPV